MDEILELIKSDINKAYKSFVSKSGVEQFALEYKNDRKVRGTQVGNRPDKTTKNEVVKTSKIPIPFQRKIVKSASSFLFGSHVKLVASETNEGMAALTKIWNDIRMDAMLLKFAKTAKSETEATIIFYPVNKEGQDIKIKARLIDNSKGKVYPIFDQYGDMVAFGWEYEKTVGDKKTKFLHIWTDETNYVYETDSNNWAISTGYPKPNLFKKIPVVYMSQEQPEWWEVQDLIDRFENSFSKFADTNDYFSSPMYKATGGVTTMPKKDDTGKMVKLDVIETEKGNIITADLDVISWDRAPEALKLEFETTMELIFGLSDTTYLTFEKAKGLGAVSGVAMRLMFFGSILKAKWDEGDYQTAISRVINILKAGISNITESKLKSQLEELEIDIKFTSVLPENIKEVIEILTEATGGKAVMSQKTAVSHNPLVEDNEAEMESIEEELKAANVVGIGETVV